MSTDTGGPAFPVEMNNPSDKEIVGFAGDMLPPNTMTEYPGMTLRDYFAAKAMQSFKRELPEAGDDDIAGWSYELADAMLKARQA